jgi:hypothetical protein
MQGKAPYIRPKVIVPFLRPCTSGSYMHRAALFYGFHAPKVVGPFLSPCTSGSYVQQAFLYGFHAPTIPHKKNRLHMIVKLHLYDLNIFVLLYFQETLLLTLYTYTEANKATFHVSCG